MKVKDLRLKITDKNGESIIIGFNDLYGYEGELCGVFIKDTTIENQKSKFSADIVNRNSGCGYYGLDKDFAECEVEIANEN